MNETMETPLRKTFHLPTAGNLSGNFTCRGRARGIFAAALLVGTLLTSGAGKTWAQTPGTVVGWGNNQYGQNNIPAGLGPATAIAAGPGFDFAVKSDGTVVGWGVSADGRYPPPLNDAKAVGVGTYHGVALKNNGTVVAWGNNQYGQTDVPAGLSGVTAIAATVYYSMALKDDGTVVAWGYSGNGQTNIPVGLKDVVAIAAGGGHSLALKEDGTVVVWGSNLYGETDVPSGLSGVTAIAAGNSHSLALKNDGTVVAWGRNVERQCTVPVGLSNVSAIAAGGGHSLALKKDGTVVAWGLNNVGQTNVPAGLSSVTAIAAGPLHNLAIFSAADTTPPVITPHVSGDLHNGWYISTVMIDWSVSDPESSITSQTGCGSGSVTSDTSGTPYTCSATSTGGTNSQSVTIKRDATSPTVTCGAPDGLWHATDVAIACSASDATSLLSNPANSSFNLVTGVANGVETASAFTSSRIVGDNAGNTIGAGPFGGNKIDKKAPSIVITSPAAASYALNQMAPANYSCSDGASGVASCVGPAANGANFNTSSVGTKTFTVAAADNVGNNSNASVSYSVTYNFSGYLAPVNSPPAVNTGKSGRTYPIKWQLRDFNGAFISTLAAVTSVTYQSTSCGAFAGNPTDPIEANTTGSSGLRYDSTAKQYVYNWATPGIAGCYTLFVTLDSGQVFPAYFNLSN